MRGYGRDVVWCGIMWRGDVWRDSRGVLKRTKNEWTMSFLPPVNMHVCEKGGILSKGFSFLFFVFSFVSQALDQLFERLNRFSLRNIDMPILPSKNQFPFLCPRVTTRGERMELCSKCPSSRSWPQARAWWKDHQRGWGEWWREAVVRGYRRCFVWAGRNDLI